MVFTKSDWNDVTFFKDSEGSPYSFRSSSSKLCLRNYSLCHHSKILCRLMPTSCLGGVRGWFFIRCWHCSFLVPSAKNCYCSIQNRICQHKWRSTSLVRYSFNQKEKISLWVPESHFISRVKPCKITMYNEILSYYPERWRFCGIFNSRIRDLAGSVFFPVQNDQNFLSVLKIE